MGSTYACQEENHREHPMNLGRVGRLIAAVPLIALGCSARAEPGPLPTNTPMPTVVEAAQAADRPVTPAAPATADHPAAPSPTAAVKPTAPSLAAPAQVGIAARNLLFEPRTITVKAGTTVTWTNFDAFEHTVTADDNSFQSDLFGQGETFSHTFSTPGTYRYYCVPHGGPGGAGMAGVVVVTE